MNIKGLITAIFAGSAIVNSSNPNPDNKHLKGSHASVSIQDIPVTTLSNELIKDLDQVVEEAKVKKKTPIPRGLSKGPRMHKGSKERDL